MILATRPVYLGSFDYTSGSGRLTRQFNYAARVAGREVVLSAEHVRYRWARPDDLGEITMSAETRATLRDWWRQPAQGGSRQDL